MKETRLFIPNAIVFVHDPSHPNVEEPEYVRHSLVSASNSCISIGTRAYVDGEVVLRLSNHASPHVNDLADKRVFSGRLESPSKVVAILSAELEKILDIEVHHTVVDVTVWVDDITNPGVVSVVVSEQGVE